MHWVYFKYQIRRSKIRVNFLVLNICRPVGHWQRPVPACSWQSPFSVSLSFLYLFLYLYLNISTSVAKVTDKDQSPPVPDKVLYLVGNPNFLQQGGQRRNSERTPRTDRYKKEVGQGPMIKSYIRKRTDIRKGVGQGLMIKLAFSHQIRYLLDWLWGNATKILWK